MDGKSKEQKYLKIEKKWMEILTIWSQSIETI